MAFCMGVMMNPMKCPLKSTGMDHLQLLLNRRYFQYVPNPYYCDVEIMYDRLNNLPQESSLWSGLAVIERPNKNHDNDPVEHPLNPDPEEPLWI